MLKPIVRLTLWFGLGYSEFSVAAKRVFVEVASQDYGVRGRPANISRISAKTGLPRKLVTNYRSNPSESDWSPDDEVSPINTIIHYWRFDDRFCLSPGVPRDLPYQGDSGLVALIRMYIGDIPASTIRQELLREGIAEYTPEGLLALRKRYSYPELLDEDFLRNAAFSLSQHGNALVHNAKLIQSGRGDEKGHRDHGWFERFAWSRRMSAREVKAFQIWARIEGAEFLQRADAFISEHEDIADIQDQELPSYTGLGVYFFGED